MEFIDKLFFTEVVVTAVFIVLLAIWCEICKNGKPEIIRRIYFSRIPLILFSVLGCASAFVTLIIRIWSQYD